MGFFDKIAKAVNDFLEEQPDYAKYGEATTGGQPAVVQNGDAPLFNQRPPEGVALFMGVSTGELLKRGHAAGVLGNQCVWLENDDCCQNIVVFGGIGAGENLAVQG